MAFSRGNIKLLTNDLMEMKPTIFPTVPRLLNRIYDKVRLDIHYRLLSELLVIVPMGRGE